MNVLHPNLSFEDELMHPTRACSKGTLAALSDLAPLMGLAGKRNDRIFLPTDSLPRELPDCLNHVTFTDKTADYFSGDCEKLIPWGWTQRMLNLSEQRQQSDPPPRLGAVELVNSRRFLATFDTVIHKDDPEHHAKVSFGSATASMKQFESICSQLLSAGHRRLVVKPQISHAGRNRLFVDKSALNSQQVGWLNKRINDGVYVEPWVARVRDWSVQFEILHPDSESRTPIFLGATQLLNDSEGRYAGNILTPPETLSEIRTIIDQAKTVCNAAQTAGYWGPLGIDAFEFRDLNGTTALRLCNDINARFTMGRLALHFCNDVPEGKYSAWCQFPQRLDATTQLKNSDPQEYALKILARDGLKNVAVTRTSPMFVGSRPVRTTTLLLTGSTTAELIHAKQLLHGTL